MRRGIPRLGDLNGPRPSHFLCSLLLAGIWIAGYRQCQAMTDDAKDSAKPDLPTDLDLVPRDAAAFVHVRAADLWQSAWARDFRYLVDKAGPESWKAFQKKCPLDPSSLDRITLIMLTPQSATEPFPTVDPEYQSALVMVTTSKPFGRLPLIQALGAHEKVYRQNLYYFNEELWSGLVLIDDRTFLIGSEDALVRYFQISRQPNRVGPLQAALTAAAGKHLVAVGLNPTLFGKEKGAQFMPPPLQKLLEARCAFMTLDLDQAIHLDIRLDFQSQDQARAGEKAMRDALDLARQGIGQGITQLESVLNDRDKEAVANMAENFAALVGLGFLRDLDTLLKEAPVQRQDLAVKLSIKYKNAFLTDTGGPLLVYSAGVASIGMSVSRTFGRVFGGIDGKEKDPIEEHLRNLAQAMDRYQEKHGRYPPQAICDREGRSVLSWRVALLPYLGEEALYGEFKLDEPWDSLHNKRLLKKLPAALRSPEHQGWGAARWKTTTQVFTGSRTNFEGKEGLRASDAAKQAILLAHVANDSAVYWTKPADLVYVPDQPLPNLFGKYGGSGKALLADGTYRSIDKTMEEKSLRALIERKADKPRPEAPAPKLGQLETCWNDFSQNDDASAKKAWQGIAAMIQTPEKAVPFLKDRVKPVPRVDSKKIDQWLADIDSRDFSTREQATKNLNEAGELALPAIEKKLADKGLSLEARRRLEAQTEKARTVLSAEELRGVRAIEVLHGIGTPDAKAMLLSLARGGEGAIITEQAKNALASLDRRSGGKKE